MSSDIDHDLSKTRDTKEQESALTKENALNEVANTEDQTLIS